LVLSSGRLFWPLLSKIPLRVSGLPTVQRSFPLPAAVARLQHGALLKGRSRSPALLIGHRVFLAGRGALCSPFRPAPCRAFEASIYHPWPSWRALSAAAPPTK